MSDKEEKVKEWIMKADHDLGTAKIIFLHIPDYFEIIAFHCQQAIEKYIKGLLLYYDVNFRKTHDLVFLLDLLSEKIEIPENLYNEALNFEGFGVELRYPNHKIFLTKDMLEEILKVVEEFRGFFKQNIDFKID